MSYSLPFDSRTWSDELFQNLTDKIKMKFKISDVNLYEDQPCTIAIENMDDLKSLFEVIGDQLMKKQPSFDIYATHDSEKQEYFNFTVNYEDERTQYAFPINIQSWDNKLWHKMIKDIKHRLNIKYNIIIYEDEECEVKVDDIDGLQNLVEDEELDSDFSVDLYIGLDLCVKDDYLDDVDYAERKEHEDYDEQEEEEEEDDDDDEHITNYFNYKKSIDINTTFSNLNGHKTMHRIYFVAPSKCYNISLHFPDISTSSVLICLYIFIFVCKDQ